MPFRFFAALTGRDEKAFEMPLFSSNWLRKAAFLSAENIISQTASLALTEF